MRVEAFSVQTLAAPARFRGHEICSGTQLSRNGRANLRVEQPNFPGHVGPFRLSAGKPARGAKTARRRGAISGRTGSENRQELASGSDRIVRCRPVGIAGPAGNRVSGTVGY